MFLILFLLFTLLPAFELYLLIQVGGEIGALNTIGIVLLTGVMGAFLARSQGFIVYRKLSLELSQGGVPGRTLIEGVLIFLGGLLLIIPGFVTDLAGLSFVFPLTRYLWSKLLFSGMKRGVSRGRVFHVSYHQQGEDGPSYSPIRDVTPIKSGAKKKLNSKDEK